MSGPEIVTSRTRPPSTSLNNWLNMISLLGDFCAGLWNRVTNASTSRKMITQRAKLRKLAFIAILSTSIFPLERGLAVQDVHLSASGSIAKGSTSHPLSGRETEFPVKPRGATASLSNLAHVRCRPQSFCRYRRHVRGALQFRRLAGADRRRHGDARMAEAGQSRATVPAIRFRYRPHL